MTVWFLLCCSLWGAVGQTQGVPPSNLVSFKIFTLVGTGSTQGVDGYVACFQPLSNPRSAIFNYNAIRGMSLVLADNGNNRLCQVTNGGSMTTYHYPQPINFDSKTDLPEYFHNPCCRYGPLLSLRTTRNNALFAIDVFPKKGVVRYLSGMDNPLRNLTVSGFYLYSNDSAASLQVRPLTTEPLIDRIQPVTALWVDALDNLYVGVGYTIVLLSAASNYTALTRIAGTGILGSNPIDQDGLPALHADLGAVTALTGDTADIVYFGVTLNAAAEGANVHNTFVRFVQPNGLLYTLMAVRSTNTVHLTWLPPLGTTADGSNDQDTQWFGFSLGSLMVGFDSSLYGVAIPTDPLTPHVYTLSLDVPSMGSDACAVSSGGLHVMRVGGPNPGFADGMTPSFGLIHSVTSGLVPRPGMPSTNQPNAGDVLVLISDSSNNCVRGVSFTEGGKTITRTLAGFETTTYSGDGQASSSQVSSPCGLDVNPAGTAVYFIDVGNSLLRVVADGLISTVFGQPGVSQGTNSLSKFAVPLFAGIDIAVNWSTSTLDEDGMQIFYINAQSQQMLQMVFQSDPVYGTIDGPYRFPCAELQRINGTMNLIQMDRRSTRLLASGSVHTNDDVTHSSAVFDRMWEVTNTDRDAVDVHFHCILNCAPLTTSLAVLAVDYYLDELTAFDFDADDHVVVLQRGWKFFSIEDDGSVKTLWSDPEERARFGDFVIDLAGNIFATDGNYRIYQLGPGGSQTLVAGAQLGFSGDDGVAVRASLNLGGLGGNRFCRHDAMAIAANAYSGEVIFFSDTANNRIRTLNPILPPKPPSSDEVFIQNPANIGMVVGGNFAAITLCCMACVLSRRREARLQRQLKLERERNLNRIYEVKLLSRETAQDIPLKFIDRRELDVKLDVEVGRGEFATVYLAQWHGGMVAFKQIRASADVSDEEFEHEFLVNALLGNHPHVVPFYGGGLDSKFLVFFHVKLGSMEQVLISGGKLKQQFPVTTPGLEQDTDPLPWLQLINNLAVVTQMLMDAAAGVMYCHSKRVIHRDIAARNFLVDPLNRVTICDFGMARQLPPGDPVGQIRTSERVPVPWAAPETLTQHILSVKTDVYSFGIFLFEIASRGAPYPRVSYAEIIQWVPDKVKPLRPTIRNCPLEWVELMRKCWSALPDDRPTMSHVFESLQSFRLRIGAAMDAYLRSDRSAGELLKLRAVYNPVSDEGALPSDRFQTLKWTTADPEVLRRYAQPSTQTAPPSQPAPPPPLGVVKQASAGELKRQTFVERLKSVAQGVGVRASSPKPADTKDMDSLELPDQSTGKFGNSGYARLKEIT